MLKHAALRFAEFASENGYMDHLVKYRLAFDITPLPLVLVTAAGKIVLANKPFSKLFGFEPGALDNQLVETLMPNSMRQDHPKQRSAFFRVPTKRAMGKGRDLTGLTAQGKTIPLELAIEPVLVGNTTCAMLTAIDITERKKREEQLRQALDATSSGMVLSDAQGHVVLVNQAASSLLGYGPHELVGLPIAHLVPNDLRISHEVLMKNAMDGHLSQNMSGSRAIYAQQKNGKRIPVDIALNQIDTPDGWLVMSTITDLRDQIAFEEAMREKNALLASLNDELSQFAYSASHDLKAPLVSVMGLLRICLEDLEDGDPADLVANLQKALEISTRSSKQVEGILELARAGQKDLKPDTINLAVMIESLWENLCAADPVPKLTLQVPKGLTVTTEIITLRVILDNLIGNALKYRDPQKDGVDIKVQAKPVEGHTQITVQDNGCGIDPDHQEKIFDMFQSFDDRSGAGLGLALVNKHVARLGGEISIMSQLGKGTSMTFTLPDAARAAP